MNMTDDTPLEYHQYDGQLEPPACLSTHLDAPPLADGSDLIILWIIVIGLILSALD